MKTEYGDSVVGNAARSDAERALALVLVWSSDEPDRVGEAVLLPEGARGVLGRADPDAEQPPLVLQRQRPGRNQPTGPLRAGRVSRRQLSLEAADGFVAVTNEGRAAMVVNGRACRQAVVRPGDLVEIERRVSLLCVERPTLLPGFVARPHRFGDADPHGLVGESEASWTLRSQLAFVAPRTAHVLVLGESGTGKELAARALHAQSRRAEGPFVTRSAATIPESLVDAELFGNARNYPNPGMPARPGMIGEAHRGTLFLDEIGEMPHAQQAHLLRVLDEGEYHRLGDPQARTADLRLVAATNRAAEALKHDFAARLPIRLRMPGLGDRREDLSLLARHLLRGLAEADPDLATRFLVDGEPQLSQELVRQLCGWSWTTHVRELQALLWRSMVESPGQVLEPVASAPEPALSSDEEPSRARLEAALAAAGGSKTRAAEALGLRNRFQLLRLLKKHGIG